MTLKMEPPANWLKTIENIRRVRRMYPAPVDSMGCDQAHDRADKDINQRFQVLVSLMLSSQTKDPITWAAVQKLKEAGLGNVKGLRAAKEKDIEDLIHPVGFFRRKAVYLKKVADILDEQYQGDIPDNLKDLCKLPGVGPKMAHLCMLEAWNVVSGIGVDTHVHRISARLNWVPKKGIKDPEDTRKALESWLPKEYWREINHLLVGFGQTICTPLRPKCNQCANSDICPSSSVKPGRRVEDEDGQAGKNGTQDVNNNKDNDDDQTADAPKKRVKVEKKTKVSKEEQSERAIKVEAEQDNEVKKEEKVNAAPSPRKTRSRTKVKIEQVAS